jgi:DNA-binding NtrC family response regulator
MEDAAESLIRRVREKRALSTLLGEAPAFLKAISHLLALAHSDEAVLITGETGTGKELVARAIHYLSDRAAFPFVAVNCGSLPDTLLENELFGHERGAFTDAGAGRPGLVSQAEKGTVFLDEIEMLSPRAAVALLRVLQDKRFRTLGSSREQQADVRFLAATNVQLGRLVEAGTFRADLYYRLCVFSVDLPPLRDRKEDIPLLAAHFLKKHSPPGEVLTLIPAAAAALAGHDWPGNVRELENAIIRGIQVSQTGAIRVEDLGLPSTHAGSPAPASVVAPAPVSFKALRQRTIEIFERDYLIQMISEHHGNVTRAARAAGKDRREFGKLLKKYHLDPKLFFTAPSRLETSERESPTGR